MKKKLTGADRLALAATLSTKYAQGASIRNLAKEIGRSYGFAHRLLTEAGVELRTRGGAVRHKRKD